MATNTHLKQLELNRNKINKLDTVKLSDMKNIESLSLETNQLTIIDKFTLKSNTLKRLSLSCNPIELIEPGVFDNLTQLIRLYLEKLNLKDTDVQSNLFVKLTKLKELSLNHNQLENVSSEMFNGLAELGWLWLRNSTVKSIDVNAFKSLANLEYLWLDANKLFNIWPGTFKPLKKVKKLYIGNNQLNSLNASVFKGLASLKKLDIWKVGNKMSRFDDSIVDELTIC